ncbi:MAG: DegV family EDD domain-containing protein [Lachnospiraceae bacterium]|nr:DegV family EDD domain-containing protein [Lachnospiraceae bacterium]
MKIIRFIKDIIAAVKDPNRNFLERTFLVFATISEFAGLIALAGDIIMQENMREIIVLIITLIMVPVVTFISFYKNKVMVGSRILILGMVLMLLPALFFFGGGLRGGGVLWIMFAFMFIGLAVSGALRVVLIITLCLMTIGCYLLGYYHPELIYQHSMTMFYVDSVLSLLIVGGACFAMTWVQSRLFKEENERAKKEAERAEELTRAQNRFFSSMSHEIRTPINSILGLNELILRDTEASDEIVKEAQGIQGSGKMLLALINDILDFSKMEAGSMDLVPVDYKVGEMLSEIVNMVWIRAHDKGLQFNVSIDPKVPSVLFGDEVRIKQVLVNLLNNAVKYTAEGSVELHVESEGIDDGSVELNISVTDTGMGIKKESLPYLFDAFKRVDEEKNRRIEGTGLGLSIVKQLVEMMGGTVTVNSVYGEGSTFVVVLKQGVSDATEIGELNIHNKQTVKRSTYESSFRAPEARILIVDDNEMNLEVECKLLAATEMTIDRAMSGKQALEMSLKQHYDTILMDHLMPEMDGIECLENLRNQTGGLNRTTSVIVLTANAGSDNRELYTHAGFEGYLIKPVSGEALEAMLIRHISKDKLILSDKLLSMHENIHTARGYSGKLPVIITASSMCDLPDAVVKKLYLPILPFLIRTDEGVFKDGEQMDADELIRYLNSGKDAESMPPDEATYTDFFAEALKRAHHLIHISLTTSLSDEHKIAREAAKSFDNVTVINSGVVSSATGLLVLIAHRLAQQGLPVDEIITELRQVRTRLRCSFVVDTTDYMARKNRISPAVHRIAKMLSLHPCISISGDKSGIGGVWVGDQKRSYRKYIHRAFPVDIIPDEDVVFITYSAVPEETLLWIKEEIRKVAYFEHFVFQKASAAISSNCGPGSFGILYFVKSNKSYNISSYVEVADDTEDEEAGVQQRLVFERMQDQSKKEDAPEPAEQKPEVSMNKEPRWYEKLTCIDSAVAIKNSGSEDAFRTVLKIFYDAIDEKSAEISGYYDTKNWENYTIKVHALKSSAKLIGATAFAERAQLLENAGKEKDVSYIDENHAAFMADYRNYKEALAPVFAGVQDADAKEKPEADASLMESVYEGLLEAAEAMDCDAIEGILQELDDYAIPKKDTSCIETVRKCAVNYDYDGISDAVKNRQG